MHCSNNDVLFDYDVGAALMTLAFSITRGTVASGLLSGSRCGPTRSRWRPFDGCVTAGTSTSEWSRCTSAMAGRQPPALYLLLAKNLDPRGKSRGARLWPRRPGKLTR